MRRGCRRVLGTGSNNDNIIIATKLHKTCEKGKAGGRCARRQVVRSDQTGQTERSNQTGQTARSDQTGQTEGSDQTGQTEGSDQTGQTEGSDQTGQTALPQGEGRSSPGELISSLIFFRSREKNKGSTLPYKH